MNEWMDFRALFMIGLVWRKGHFETFLDHLLNPLNIRIIFLLAFRKLGTAEGWILGVIFFNHYSLPLFFHIPIEYHSLPYRLEPEYAETGKDKELSVCVDAWRVGH